MKIADLFRKGQTQTPTPETITESEAVSYSAVFFPQSSGEELLMNANSELKALGKRVPQDWKIPDDLHMTISMGKIPEKLGGERLYGKEAAVSFDAIGVSDEAIALRVAGAIPTKNAVPHVTIAFKTASVKSNDITEWFPLKKQFYITGSVGKMVESSVILEGGERKNVKLNKPFRTPDGPKKFSVYVKNDKGNIVKVNFGDPNMEIKRDDPKRRKSFRARHDCGNPGPKWKARYWSCQATWSESKTVSEVVG